MPTKENNKKIPFQQGNAAPALKKAYANQIKTAPPIILRWLLLF